MNMYDFGMNNNYQQSNKKPKNKKRLIITIVSVALLLFSLTYIILSITVFNNKDEKEKNISTGGSFAAEVSSINIKANQSKEVEVNNYTSSKLEWYSESEEVAVVDGNGNVVGVNPGTTYVVIKRGENDYVRIKVVVEGEKETEKPTPTSTENKEIVATEIRLNKSNIQLRTGNKDQLIATVLPNNAINKDITWSSSDNNVVTIDANGIIKGIHSGTATITAKTSNGVTASTVVNVISTEKIHFISHLEASGSDHNTGDAILLESNGDYAMIDMGNTDQAVVNNIINYLKELNVTKLDFVLFTHMDSDHAANLQSILNAGIKISNIWMKNYDVESYRKNYVENLNENSIDTGLAAQNTNSDNYHLNQALSRYRRIRYLAEYSSLKDLVSNIKIISNADEGSVYTYKVLKFKMILYNNTRNINAIQSENYNSIISLIEVNNHRVLLTADAFDTKQMNSIAQTIGKVDVLKLPHHGSRFCAFLPKNYNDNKVVSEGTLVNSTALASLNPNYFIITSSRKKLENIRSEYKVTAGNMCVDTIAGYSDSTKYYVDETPKALVVDLTDNIKIEYK